MDYLTKPSTETDSSALRGPVDKLAYRIDEAVLATGVGRTSLYEAIRAGELKAFKKAGRRLIRRADLEAYLDDVDHAA